MQGLHQYHNAMAYVSNTSTVSLSYEVVKHYEGVSDNNNIGFATETQAEL